MIISTSIVGILSSNAYADTPGAPTNLTNSVNPTSDTIVLTWTAPGSDGGTAITGYKIEKAIESSPGAFGSYADHNANTGNTNTTLTISGLSAGDFFNFRVSAINADGTSSPSSVFSMGTQRASNQNFEGSVQNFADNQQFGAGTKFAANQEFTGSQDFSAGSQEFAAGAKFAAGQSFSSNTQTFSGANTFAAGATFAADQSFSCLLYTSDAADE